MGVKENPAPTFTVQHFRRKRMNILKNIKDKCKIFEPINRDQQCCFREMDIGYHHGTV